MQLTVVTSACFEPSSCPLRNRFGSTTAADRHPPIVSTLPRPQSLIRSRLLSVCVNSVAKRHTHAESSNHRPIWLPGSVPPPYLNGSLAGDFGFDPLELGKDPEVLRWYVQAELVHARFAMAGAAGILFTDLLRTTGLKELPVWYEAGATKFDFANTETLFVVQLILMGFVETKRYMDFVHPGSQATEDSFFGLESALAGLENGYPGGPLFDPTGLARDGATFQVLKEKEIKNGRLAMVAMVGIFVQACMTKTGPIDNLMTHLSDPWHKTIVQTLTSLG